MALPVPYSRKDDRPQRRGSSALIRAGPHSQPHCGCLVDTSHHLERGAGNAAVPRGLAQASSSAGRLARGRSAAHSGVGASSSLSVRPAGARRVRGLQPHCPRARPFQRLALAALLRTSALGSPLPVCHRWQVLLCQSGHQPRFQVAWSADPMFLSEQRTCRTNPHPTSNPSRQRFRATPSRPARRPPGAVVAARRRRQLGWAARPRVHSLPGYSVACEQCSWEMPIRLDARRGSSGSPAVRNGLFHCEPQGS